MDIQTEKIELVRLLLDTDDMTVLRSIRNIFGVKSENHMNVIVGQDSHGQPITKVNLVERALQSNREYEEGKVVTLEELKEEIENYQP